MLRNLLYNVYAPAANNEWLLNIEKLNQYGRVFNGRKLVLIKTGPGLVAPDVIKKAFSFEAEFILVKNDPKLQETAGFIDALEELQSLREDEITFYAHTKGVRYGAAQEPQLRPVKQWRDMMYEQNLGDIPRIEQALKNFACCGCYLMRTAHASSMVANETRAWHFSGTFWWFKHSVLFSRDWRDVRATIYGVEDYLKNNLSVDEAYCLTGTDLAIGGLYKSYRWFRCSKCPYPFEFKAAVAVDLRAVKRCPECGSESHVIPEPEPKHCSSVRLSIVVPTVARSVLKRLLLQIQKQLYFADEVIVVEDGPHKKARSTVLGMHDARFIFMENPDGPRADGGASARQFGIEHAKGSHLYFLDDDDELLPEALTRIRKAVSEYADAFIVFRMYHGCTEVLWNKRAPAFTNVSTQMFVVPNDSRLVPWGTGPTCGDFEFLVAYIEKNGQNSVLFHEDFVAVHGISGITYSGRQPSVSVTATAQTAPTRIQNPRVSRVFLRRSR